MKSAVTIGPSRSYVICTANCEKLTSSLAKAPLENVWTPTHAPLRGPLDVFD